MNLTNNVLLRGNAGDAAIVRTTKNGNKVVNLRVATNYSYNNPKGEKIVETEWHNVVAWGKIADQLEHVNKGDFLVLNGKLIYENYTTETGEKKESSRVKIGFVYYAPQMMMKKAA